MKYIIKTRDMQEISLAPEDTRAEIMQNLLILLATPAGSVPFNRELGIKTDHLHRPASTARTLLAAGIYDAVARYEPRAEIIKLDFEEDHINGRLYPVMEVEIL